MPKKKNIPNAPAPDFEAMADMVMNGLAKEVAQLGLHFFLGGFEKGGFTDVNFIPWVKRQDLESRAILTKSNALKEGLEIVSETPQRIEIAVNESIPYAEIHNSGGTITVKITDKMRKFFWSMWYETDEIKYKYMALSKNDTMTINIPERQFIGNSYTLNSQIDKMAVDRILKSVQQVKPK